MQKERVESPHVPGEIVIRSNVLWGRASSPRREYSGGIEGSRSSGEAYALTSQLVESWAGYWNHNGTRVTTSEHRACFLCLSDEPQPGPATPTLGVGQLARMASWPDERLAENRHLGPCHHDADGRDRRTTLADSGITQVAGSKEVLPPGHQVLASAIS